MDTMRFAVLTLMCLLIPAGVRAAEPASPLPAPTLDQLVRQALARAPMLAEPGFRVDAARARTDAARALPDPSLELGGQAMGISPLGDNSTLTLGFQQMLPWPGKRSARRSTAESSVVLAERSLEEREARVVEDLRVAFARLYAADQERDGLAAAQDWLRVAQESTRARVAAGQADREALLGLRVQAAELRQRQAAVTAARAGYLADLNLLLGEPAEREPGVIHSLPDPDLAPRDSLEAWLETGPALQLAAADARVAERLQEEARLDLHPDFMLGAGGGLSAMGEPVAMLRLGATLPLWSTHKQRPLLRAAALGRQATEAARSALRAQALADLGRWHAEWTRAGVVAREFRDSILPLREAATEAALSGHANRGGDFAGLIEHILRRIDARTGLAEAEAERLVAWARIQRLCPDPNTQTAERTKP